MQINAKRRVSQEWILASSLFLCCEKGKFDLRAVVVDTCSEICVSASAIQKNRKQEECCCIPTGQGGLAGSCFWKRGKDPACCCAFCFPSCPSVSLSSSTVHELSAAHWLSILITILYVKSGSGFIGSFLQKSNCETFVWTEPSGFTVNKEQMMSPGVVL